MKFRITDEEGVTSVVEEIEENKKETTDEDVASLTSDEIAALKSLASIADKLKALVDKSVSDEDVDTDPEAKNPDEVTDEDEECDKDVIDDEDEDEEKVIDTDEDESIHDSIGAIRRKKSKVAANDSISTQESIAAAWAKRYGGNK